MSRRKDLPPKERAPSNSVRVPQKHGGALLTGGVVGNRGGMGAPRSEIRAAYRVSFDARRKILEDIADGVPIQKTEVPLLALAAVAECPNCGELGVVPKDADEAMFITVKALISALPKDRIAAIDMMGKYGLGAAQDVDTDAVREKVKATLQVIARHVPPELFGVISNELREVWT